MDNRDLVEELYKSYLRLSEDFGWKASVMYKFGDLPAYCFSSPFKGKAIYLTSGIHGEEPAGPMAISRSIEKIAELGRKVPIILRPLCNPIGYVNNTRYYNGETDWKKSQSVADPTHVFFKDKKPANIYAKAFTDSLFDTFKEYPVYVSIDLHEEAYESVTGDKFYIYSQGKLGIKDPIAKKIFAILKSTGMKYLKKGKTRFGEEVKDGMIGPVNDISIDQFLAKFAKTAIVTETPTGLDLEKRVEANKLIIDAVLYLCYCNVTSYAPR